MADVLTEQLRYESQIEIDGIIRMTPYIIILKNGELYLTQAQEMVEYRPGDDPDSLPAYGPALARAVWTDERVEEYQTRNPPEDEFEEPYPDEPEEPEPEEPEEEEEPS